MVNSIRGIKSNATRKLIICVFQLTHFLFLPLVRSMKSALHMYDSYIGIVAFTARQNFLPATPISHLAAVTLQCIFFEHNIQSGTSYCPERWQDICLLYILFPLLLLNLFKYNFVIMHIYQISIEPWVTDIYEDNITLWNLVWCKAAYNPNS